MSGGHFNGNGYIYHQVSQFAYELEEEIQNNNKPDEYGYVKDYSPETIKYLRKQLRLIHHTAEIMRACDYLYSGDHGEDSFMEVVREIEEKYAE